jgi:hypothetical protein
MGFDKLPLVQMGVVVVLDDILPPPNPHGQTGNGELARILVVNKEEIVAASGLGHWSTCFIQVWSGFDLRVVLHSDCHFLQKEILKIFRG